MNSYITQYNLHFTCSNRETLYQFYKDYLLKLDLIFPNFNNSLIKHHCLFIYECSVSYEDSSVHNFLDILHDLLDNENHITASGSFTDPYGYGVLSENLTKNYLTTV